MKFEKKSYRTTKLVFFCLVFFVGLGVSSMVMADYSDRRGVALGGTPANDGRFYYYDISVKINNGNPVYYTSLPSQNGKDLKYLFHYFPRSGNSYQFQVTACDSHGYQSQASVWSAPFASVFSTYNRSAKTVPIADPGEDQLVAVGELVTLDATESYDLFSGTASLQYFWECYAGPEEVSLSDPNAASPTFTPGTAGSYYFRLHVRDMDSSGNDFNRSPISYVKVNALENSDNFIIANPCRPQSVPLGSTVILDGSLSDTSSSIVYYNWEPLNRSVEIQNADQAVASFIPDTVGAYVFRLTITGEDDFSSKITIISVYDESSVGSLHTRKIDKDCVNCSVSDLENDGNVDGSDIAVFASAFNSSRGLDNYRADCDFDKNLRVDKMDLLIFSSCFGKTGL